MPADSPVGFATWPIGAPLPITAECWVSFPSGGPTLADLWLAIDQLEAFANEYAGAMGGTQEWTDAVARLRAALPAE